MMYKVCCWLVGFQAVRMQAMVGGRVSFPNTHQGTFEIQAALVEKTSYARGAFERRRISLAHFTLKYIVYPGVSPMARLHPIVTFPSHGVKQKKRLSLGSCIPEINADRCPASHGQTLVWPCNTEQGDTLHSKYTYRKDYT